VPKDLDFWRETYRDVLRELVRVEGMQVLLEARRTARLCASIATESDLALTAAVAGPVDRCATCHGQRFVFEDERGNAIDPGTPCPRCVGNTAPTPPLAASV
jgi:hypothetical protein